MVSQGLLRAPTPVRPLKTVLAQALPPHAAPIGIRQTTTSPSRVLGQPVSVSPLCTHPQPTVHSHCYSQTHHLACPSQPATHQSAILSEESSQLMPNSQTTTGCTPTTHRHYRRSFPPDLHPPCPHNVQSHFLPLQSLRTNVQSPSHFTRLSFLYNFNFIIYFLSISKYNLFD